MKHFRWVAALVAVVTGSMVNRAHADDQDEDGIDDDLEQTLIDMYRPILHYDSDQYIKPASVEWFVRHSELIWRTTIGANTFDIVLLTNSQLNDPNDPNSPLRILFEGTDDVPPSTTTLQPADVGFRLNIFDEFHDGPPGPLDAVGMYAHVTTLKGPLTYTNGPTLPSPPLTYQDLYLIQYWQFFPYNDFTAPLGSGDHEGDWMWIDLLVERSCPYNMHYMVYHHHGDDNCTASVLSIGELPVPTRPFPLPCNPANLARIPHCYLEANVHEWWPFPSDGGECEFFQFDNPSHDGQIGQVESQNVINLGERYAPMPGLEPQLVMFFNGLWGHEHGFPNGPSGGPLRQHPPGYPLSPLMVAHVDSTAPPWSAEGLGSRYHPFTTLAEAIEGPNAVTTHGRVLLAPHDYPGEYTFDRPMRLERDGSTGTVILGR